MPAAIAVGDGQAAQLQAFGERPEPSRAHARTPLERIGGICVRVPEVNRLCDDSQRVDLRVDRYMLQSVARAYLAPAAGDAESRPAPWRRLAGCHRRRGVRTLPDGTRAAPSTVDVVHDPDRQKAFYRNLQTCGSAWACPVCGGVIWDWRKGELRRGLETHRSAGGGVLFITLTARHTQGVVLAPFLDALTDALRAVYAGRDFQDLKERTGYLGAIKALEITHGGNGWHPHFHLLWLTGGRTDVSLVDAVRRYLHRRWLDELRRQGLAGLVARAVRVKECGWSIEEYMSKLGHERRWDVDAELTMAIRKQAKRRGMTPHDLLRAHLGDDAAAAARAKVLYREYADATKGRHSLQWSKGLREQLGLGAQLDDADVAAGEMGDEALPALAALSPDGWKVVLANDARGELLQVANAGDVAAVEAFMARLLG